MINNIGFNIEMMEINNGFLYIDANVSYNVLLDNQEIYINVVNRDNKTSTMIKGIKNERLNVSKLFGKNILRRYCYSFKIPLGDNLNDNLQI